MSKLVEEHSKAVLAEAAAQQRVIDLEAQIVQQARWEELCLDPGTHAESIAEGVDL